MKKAEMVVGRVYALETPGKSRVRPVTLVSKMVMTSGRVLVRIEDPRGDQVEIEVPNRWVREIRSDLPVAGLELVKSDHFDGPVAWIPEGGQVVERFDIPSVWIVRRVDVAGDRVFLDGVLFGTRRREWVSLVLVHRAEPPSKPNSKSAKPLLGCRGLDLDLPAGRHVRPAEQRTPAFYEIPKPEEIARRLDLGPNARTQYRWIAGGKAQGREQFELRREVQLRGQVCWLYENDDEFLKGEYVRYVVPARFSVVLFDDPSGDDRKILVNRIY